MLVGALSSLFRARAALELENLALRHQIGVLQRSVKKRPRLTAAGPILWAWLCGIWSDWRSALVIVKPETVMAWHRKGFRLFWTWKIRHGQVGRPAVPKEVRCPWARMRQNRDRRNRRRRGESWQFRRSAAYTIATNAGPPENDSRGCSHFAGRSVSDGQHRGDGVRTADHCPPPDRHQQLTGHSIGSRRSHVAADRICDRDRCWFISLFHTISVAARAEMIQWAGFAAEPPGRPGLQRASIGLPGPNLPSDRVPPARRFPKARP